MDLIPENSESVSSKSTYEEDALKNPDESSTTLNVNNIISNNNDNDNNDKNNTLNKIPIKEEIVPEIIPYSNSQLTLNQKKINIKKNRYPYCIVWAPIPFLTYIMPCIGYVGIANSEGVIHDFAASCYISIDEFSFGKPTKYLQLDLNDKERYEYDKAIQNGYNKYILEKYNIFWNNCHNHVAYILNQINYKGRNNYNAFDVWWILIKKGKYISFSGFVKTYIGFFIFFLIIGLSLR